ncbi:hypothetical protein [Neorhizobium galegae]|uniref:hypothetical protein n=1 Tax=Neorhizobium galegae TaxID=399 RepID=UPI0021034FFA|nr:hypothetical protein [Neorhizobium galegae]MCQ1852777.1 hypothetical protein [Neorhizobium galegae]
MANPESRVTLTDIMTRCNCWHIISYPRSGNHAVRAIVERFSGRPTLGCPGAERDDLPIYLRGPNQSLNLIKIRDQQCVARKSHFLREFIKHDAQETEAGIILITRDPLEAITSHIYAAVKPRLFRRRVKCFFAVREAVDDYLGSVFAFRAMHERKRIHVCYEDFIRPNSDVPAKLIQAMGLSARPTEAEVAETLSLAFGSLQRPGHAKRDCKVGEQIKNEISKRLTYDQVLTLARFQSGDLTVI